MKLIQLGGIAAGMLCLLICGIVLLRCRKEKQRKFASDLHVCNLHNIGARSIQQDSFCISDFQNTEIHQSKGCMAVLADGMGGLQHGAELSAVITASLLQAFDKLPAHGEENGFPDELMRYMYQQVNEFMDRSGEACGSTLLLVWIWNDHLHYRAIGDSRIYLLRKQQLVQINREHTYGRQLDDAALQSGDWNATHSDQRKAVTSYLGMPWEELMVDRNAGFIQLHDGDCIALFSDGVFHTLSEAEIVKCMMNKDPCVICKQLYDSILQKKKKNQDNYTAVIIMYRQAERKEGYA